MLSHKRPSSELNLSYNRVSSTIETMKLYQPSLSRLEAKAILSVLDDVCQRLLIMHYILPPCKNVVRKTYSSLTERFENIGSHTELTIVPSREKLQIERTFLDTILAGTTGELATECQYPTLIGAITKEKFLENDENQVIIMYQTLNSALTDIENSFAELTTQFQNNLKQFESFNIPNQERLMDDFLLNHATRKSYLNRWEDSRSAQNNLEIEMEERILKKEINSNHQDVRLEYQISNQIEMYLAQNQSALQDLIADWTLTYNTELEKRDIELNRIKAEREQLHEDYDKLQQLYEDQKAEMIDLKEFLEIIANERKYEEMINRMARKIQVWWKRILNKRKKLIKKNLKGDKKTAKKKK